MAEAIRWRCLLAIWSTCDNNAKEVSNKLGQSEELSAEFNHLNVTAQNDDGWHQERDQRVNPGVVHWMVVGEFRKTGCQLGKEFEGRNPSDQRRNSEQQNHQPAQAEANENPLGIHNCAVMKWRGNCIETVTIQSTGCPDGHEIEKRQQEPLHCAGPVYVV